MSLRKQHKNVVPFGPKIRTYAWFCC